MTVDIFESWLQDPFRRPLVMGVLNVTPDSFSDGGAYLNPADAVGRAVRMVEVGADVLDLGAESTRPGSSGVAADEQVRRLLPVLEEVRKRLPAVVISIDTTSGVVAEASLKLGARIVNDISGGTFDPSMLGVVRGHGAAVVLMHMQGTPATMQVNPSYRDVTREVGDYLEGRVRAAVQAGIPPHRILVDPGIGFGKTVDHNLTLLRNTGLLAGRLAPRPVVIGTSRKGFIGKVTGESIESGRGWGTAATVAYAVANGAAVVRVHDVGEMARVVRMTSAIVRGYEGDDVR